MDTETITIRRGGGLRDKYNNPIPAAAEFDVDGVLFAPGPSTEPGHAADQVATEATVYAPAGTDIRADDQAIARGDLWNVVGTPQDWGSAAGVIAVLHRTTG